MYKELISGKGAASISNTSPEPSAFFSVVAEQFEQATQTFGDSLDYFYCIAGHTIRLCFAGPSLLPKFTRAFAHLASAPTASPELTICIWDSASTHTQMPAPPWSWDVRTTRGDIVGYNNTHIRTAFQTDAGGLSMLDSSTNVGLFWVQDASHVPYYETSSPLRRILHWWLSDHGKQLIHAAALGTPSGGVLLAGPGGAGKSTTALSCVTSKLSYASDDYCVVSIETTPRAYSLFSSAKVDRQMLLHLPHLTSAVDRTELVHQEKAVLFLWEHFPENLVRDFPIQAILLPRVENRRETDVSPASPMEGIRALAPSTMVQLAGAGRAAWQTMTNLFKSVPCYHLHLSPNLTQIPPVITRLLEKSG